MYVFDIDKDTADERLQLRTALLNNERVPFVYQRRPASVDVSGICVVSCCYSMDKYRRYAAESAAQYWGNCLPRPRHIVVEGRYDDDSPVAFPDWIEKIPVSLTDSNRYIWLKESLLDIGIDQAFSDPGVFAVVLLDIDSVFCDPLWSTYVYKALEEYPVVYPGGLMYNVCPEGVRDTHCISEAKCRFWEISPSEQCVYRLTVAFTRDYYRYIGRLPKDQTGQANLVLYDRTLEEGTPVSCANQAMFHIAHQRRPCYYQRRKGVLREVFRRGEGPVIDYTERIPVWMDSELAKKARAEFMALEEGERVWIEECEQYDRENASF